MVRAGVCAEWAGDEAFAAVMHPVPGTTRKVHQRYNSHTGYRHIHPRGLNRLFEQQQLANEANIYPLLPSARLHEHGIPDSSGCKLKWNFGDLEAPDRSAGRCA
jgi:hypothetical protein